MPRPLRTPTQPWGLPGLRRVEREAVRLGNNLYRSVIHLMLACWHMTVPCLMEHPEDHGQAHLVSSWRLDQTRLLAKLDNMVLTNFDQCAFGAACVKPTGLLHGHMPELHDRLQARGLGGRCPHPPGAHRPLRGQREGGGWNTSPAKTYPTMLCCTLGTAIADSIAVLPPWAASSSAAPDEELASLFMPLDPYTTDRASFGPDTFYAGWS